MVVSFQDLALHPRDIPKVRGFFANTYRDNVCFHHHTRQGGYDYSFPTIQYRLIDGHPAIVGINEGIEHLKAINSETVAITIENKRYEVRSKHVSQFSASLGFSSVPISYRFTSPWMALNEENFKKWKDRDESGRDALLQSILLGNIKSLCKGLQYWIPQVERLQVKGDFTPLAVTFKNKRMQCFSGSFSLNFHIPDLLGLGKQSARGFGVITRTDA